MSIHPRITWLRLLAGVIVLLALSKSPNLAADEPELHREQATSLDRLKKSAAEYEMTSDDAIPLQLVIAPVLRFSDPVSSVPDGALFLWTSGERPQAAAAFWSNTAGRAWVEFQSLATQPLTATRSGRVEWKPRTAGVSFQPVQKASVSDKTAAARLTQMRAITRSVTASISDDKLGRQELRILPQPVYRYQDEKNGIVDGALFVFARSTNPELLVLIEAKPIDGEPRWHYALARMTGRDCEVRLNDEVVWTAAGVGRDRNPARTYLQLNTKLAD